MHTAYRYRLYPNADQRTLITKHFGCTRFVYNMALDLRIKAYADGKKMLSQFALSGMLPKLKKEAETAWLSEVCSHSLQCEMANLDVAYTRFFREKKGFPKFKSKHTDRKSYSTNVNITVGDDFVRLPKLGKVSSAISRPADGHIVKATVSQTATGKYFVSVLCSDDEDTPEKLSVTAEGTVGIDLGLKHFAVLSTGEKVENPRFHKKSLKAVKRAQRKLSRKVKGSKNRDKQRRRLARVHERLTNRRKDFQHKLSTRLVGENKTNAIALETLSISGMQKNHRLARSIADAGWAGFVSMIEYKCERAGKTVLRIGRFEPSSRLCTCGTVNRALKLSDRRWTCSDCGATHDRDLLAANNIKNIALHPKQFITAGGAGNHACGEGQ